MAGRLDQLYARSDLGAIYTNFWHTVATYLIQVWELRLEYMIEKYDTAMKFLWPLMRHRRAPDARQGASPSRRGVNHLRHQPSQLRTAQAHHNPLGDLSLTRAALSK